MPGMSNLVLAKIEQIEALHEREREIYREIREMGELVHDNAWDKLAKEVVEARAEARRLSEDAEANLAGFNWMLEHGSDEELVEITPDAIWADVSPKLREMFAGNKKSLQMIDQIDKLTAAKKEMA